MNGRWLATTIPAGAVLVVGHRPYEIAQRVSATELALAEPWPLSSITTSNYAILAPYRVVPPADQVLQAQTVLAGYEEYNAQAATWLAGSADQGVDGRGRDPIRLLPCPERLALGPKPPTPAGRARVSGISLPISDSVNWDLPSLRLRSPLSGLVPTNKLTLSVNRPRSGPPLGVTVTPLRSPKPAFDQSLASNDPLPIGGHWTEPIHRSL